MTVTIYLRAIVIKKKDHLVLFDSNRNCDIDNLITDVKKDDTIDWELDCNSGIKSISSIYSKEDKHPVFKKNPKKKESGKGFELNLENAEQGEEKYAIECILDNDAKLITDPYIRIPPVR